MDQNITPDINSPLIEVTKDNTHPANIDVLYDKYGKDKVDEAIKYLTYKKEPKPMPKEEDPEKPILYVFRHGQSNDNVNMIFSGWRKAYLSEKGRQDSEILADLLKNKKFDLLISSDQPRTIETMKIAMSKNESAKNLEIQIDKRLRERHYGDWQGYSKLEKYLEDKDALSQVRRGWFNPPPNGESIAMCEKRVNDFLNELVPLMKTHNLKVAVACSNNSIRPIRKKFENLSIEEASEIDTPTGKDYAAYTID